MAVKEIKNLKNVSLPPNRNTLLELFLWRLTRSPNSKRFYQNLTRALFALSHRKLFVESERNDDNGI